MRQDVSLAGAVDMHAHCGPSSLPRRLDGYELAVEAAEVGMDAVVMKEHFLPTQYGVSYIDRLLERDGHDIDVFGSIALNYSNGGFNPFAVQKAIEYGTRVIWAPTIDSREDGQKSGGLGKKLGVDGGRDPEYEGKSGVYALDDDGELASDVRLCLDKIVENDVVFCIGHLSNEETFAIVEYLADRDHDRIVIDHPNYYVTDLDLDQQRRLADMGAHLNFPFCSISPRFAWTTPAEMAENIRELGPDQCIVSSDLGQMGNPRPTDGLVMLGELLLMEGITESEFRTTVESNPKTLLGIGE